MAWSFFATTLENVRDDHELSYELDIMVNRVETKNKIKFPDGYNPNCSCIRLTLDPVKAIHRPFFFYAVSDVKDFIHKSYELILKEFFNVDYFPIEFRV